MMVLPFAETDGFYKRLDDAVKTHRGCVVIQFPDARPDLDSKLWPRLRHVSNWSEIEQELRDVGRGVDRPVNKILNPNGLVLAGGEIALIALLGTLLAGLIAYAIYKSRRVRLQVKTVPAELELEIA
jgi:hypothetical protein